MIKSSAMATQCGGGDKTKGGILTPDDAERLLCRGVTPEAHRLITLRYGDYRSDREIAERLGKTCEAVRREFHDLAEMGVSA